VSRPAYYVLSTAGLCVNTVGLWPLGFRAFGPVGFWVCGRWDFGPLAFETGNLKFQCEVRSSPEPNNAMSPSSPAPCTEGRRASNRGLWLFEFCAWPPALLIISTSVLGSRLKFNGSAAAFGFWLWVFGPLGLGVRFLGDLCFFFG